MKIEMTFKRFCRLCVVAGVTGLLAGQFFGHGSAHAAVAYVEADVIHVTNPAPLTCAQLNRCAPVYWPGHEGSWRLGLRHVGMRYINLRIVHVRSGRVVQIGLVQLPAGCAGRSAAVLYAYYGPPGGTLYEQVYACGRIYLVDVT